MMHWQPRPEGKVVKGVIMVESTLHGCPHCKTQLIAQAVKVMGDQDWKDVNSLARSVRIPDGIDLRPVFRSA